MFFFLFLSKTKIKKTQKWKSNHQNTNKSSPPPEKSTQSKMGAHDHFPLSVLGLHPAQTCANFACAATVCMSSYVPQSIVPGSHCFLGVIHHL